MTIGQKQRFVRGLLLKNTEKGSSGAWTKEALNETFPEVFEPDPDNEGEIRLCTTHIDDPIPEEIPDPASIQYHNDEGTQEFYIYYGCVECNQEYKMCHDCRCQYWHMMEIHVEFRQIEETLKDIANKHPGASLKILSLYPDIFKEIENPTMEQINHVLDIVTGKANADPEQVDGFYDYYGTKSSAKHMFKMILEHDTQDPAICKRAVEFDYELLEYVKVITDELYQIAYAKSPYAFEFRKNPTDKEIQDAVIKCAYLMKFVPEERQTNALHMIALVFTTNYSCIQYFKNVKPSVYEYAVSRNGDALRFINIKDVTYKMIAKAFDTCRDSAESTLLQKKYLEKGKQFSGCSYNPKSGEIISFSLKNENGEYEDGNMEEWEQILSNFTKEHWILTPEENQK